MLKLEHLSFSESPSVIPGSYRNIIAQIPRVYSFGVELSDSDERYDHLLLHEVKKQLVRHAWNDTYGELIPLVRELREIMEYLEGQTMSNHSLRGIRLLAELTEKLSLTEERLTAAANLPVSKPKPWVPNPNESCSPLC